MEWIDFKLELHGDPDGIYKPLVRAWWEGRGSSADVQSCRNWVRFTTLKMEAVDDEHAVAHRAVSPRTGTRGQFAKHCLNGQDQADGRLRAGCDIVNVAPSLGSRDSRRSDPTTWSRCVGVSRLEPDRRGPSFHGQRPHARSRLCKRTVFAIQAGDRSRLRAVRWISPDRSPQARLSGGRLISAADDDSRTICLMRRGQLSPPDPEFR